MNEYRIGPGYASGVDTIRWGPSARGAQQELAGEHC